MHGIALSGLSVRLLAAESTGARLAEEICGHRLTRSTEAVITIVTGPDNHFILLKVAAKQLSLNSTACGPVRDAYQCR
ncbi:hypothetical protein [Streptomyces sp. NBC_01264]|uniref:hypothetical protein n=1 Tax=Streptomyces sp. NBC_01264 TaxID=2903804 RepID=UPI002259E105|nr:hypothetical protein [Streptomyces sp. NBC_01264]MCX4776157.1 hypothetical protein [Streptomyces sp. NBC_01264]